MRRASIFIDRLKIRIADGADPKVLADAVGRALAELPPERLGAFSSTRRQTLMRREGEDAAALGRRLVRKGMGGGS